MSEGQKGGEFFTPTSKIVKLIVEIIEPFGGRIFDLSCGSGGHVRAERSLRGASTAAAPPAGPTVEPALNGAPARTISIFGQWKVAETVRLCRMNLAVNGLEGDIDQGNSYDEDPHTARAKLDFVMANPPFNVDKVDKERLADDPRFPFGLPKTDNANYLWIQLFYSSLNATGRAGFVMANSAAHARVYELEIRRKLIEAAAVDVMVVVGSNFLDTVTLPCTLWFFDRGKGWPSPPAPLPTVARGGWLAMQADTVLFLDARHIFRQVDRRRHRRFTPEQIEFLATIVRLYRGEDLTGYTFDPAALGLTPIQLAAAENAIRNTQYANIPGLCKVATCGRNRGSGLEPEPRPLRGRGRARRTTMATGASSWRC